MTARVTTYFLGGTISMSSADGHSVRPTLSGDDLLAAVPGLEEVDAEVTAEQVAREQSGSLTYAHLLAVLESARSSESDGFVLVQGTDTLEESAYLLDLLWDDPRPFVATGAMRNPTMAGADGAANLLTAVRVAASPTARERGACVVFADEIHAARHVTKSDTASISTFRSPNTGPAGRVLEGHVHFFSPPGARSALGADVSNVTTVDVEVPVLVAGFGQSVRTLEAIADDADALVLAGFGAGHVPGWWAEAVGAIAERMPVVMTSRTHSGPALVETYGAVGAEVDLQQRGVVMGGYLDALKARLLVSVLLAAGTDREQIEAAVRRHGGYR